MKRVVGKNVLESLTTGMYSNNNVIFREYIQNSTDAIDSAITHGILEKEEHKIDISINTNRREIRIRDNGIGIPSGKLESIFEPFYQENDQKLTESGTGLGLYITKNLVEQMGGNIWVESKIGKGSTFYISIPII